VKPDKTIVERIANLLALAEGTSNPNEAAVAAAQAQRLMTKHQIKRADIEGSDDDIRHDDEALFTGKRIKSWLIALANGVAKSNGCMTVVARDETTNRVFLIGREEDIAVSRALFKYLRREIDHHVRIARAAGFLRGDGNRTKEFRLGIVVSVCMALDNARQQTIYEHSSTAIVKLDDADKAEQWAYENIPSLKENTKRVIEVDQEGNAFNAGRIIGEQIPLINPRRTIEE
jgi:hypothetical protein